MDMMEMEIIPNLSIRRKQVLSWGDMDMGMVIRMVTDTVMDILTAKHVHSGNMGLVNNNNNKRGIKSRFHSEID